jgi:hypothetical protein
MPDALEQPEEDEELELDEDGLQTPEHDALLCIFSAFRSC